MTEKQIKHYEISKENFEKSKLKKLSNISEQLTNTSEKLKRLVYHHNKLRSDFDKLSQQEFPPIEKFYQKTVQKSVEAESLDSFTPEELQEALEYQVDIPNSEIKGF